MVKVLIFDFDGTIADSPTTAFKIFDELADEYNFPHITDEQIMLAKTQGLKELIKTLQIPKYKVPIIIKKAFTLLNGEIDGIKTYSDIPKTLKKLKELNYTLGIVTSNKSENVKKFLKINHLDFFDFIYSESDLFGKDKKLVHLIKRLQLIKKGDLVCR